jgi:broad specificity phosphatase PhoE
MRLVLVRHGETEYNRGRLALGRFDAPLNEHGQAQARAVAGSFRRAPDAIYASPLKRALDTAEAIGAQTGIKVAVEDALIEMDVGEMEHLTGVELRERYPEFLRAWGPPRRATRMPGGDAAGGAGRAWAAVERMRAAHGEARSSPSRTTSSCWCWCAGRWTCRCPGSGACGSRWRRRR